LDRLALATDLPDALTVLDRHTSIGADIAHVTAGIILHIPHASTKIPANEATKLTISGEALAQELLRMTDRYADELFDLGEQAARLVFPLSRLVVDPERFADDTNEPMAAEGMGAVYTRTSDGRPLRSSLDTEERQRLLERYYVPHHERLEQLVREALQTSGYCLIIDGHSFPSSPLPCDLDQAPLRPDVCIGTDPFHTPEWLQRTSVAAFSDPGWRVELNRPYAGSMVPSSFYRKDARVYSIMVEVNRSLYMNEQTAERLAGSGEVCRRIQSVLAAIVAAAC